MSYTGSAEELASAVSSGEYIPTELAECDASLTTDRDAYVVRLVEFTLFGEATAREDRPPRVLVLRPQQLPGLEGGNDGTEDFERTHVAPLVRSWVNDLDDLGVADTPTREAREVRSALERYWHRERSVEVLGMAGVGLPPPPSNDLPDDELVNRYGEWAAEARDTYLRARLRALGDLTGTGAPAPAPRGRITIDDLVSGLVEWDRPGPFQGFDGRHAPVALCATYEQVWRPLGYTRGELVSSLSLAPGEQVTLEIHSWDKNSRKTEEELATQSEMRTTEKITQRDALTVVQEYAKHRNSSVSASGTVPIPKMPVSVSGQTSTDVRESLSQTSEAIREQTLEASTTLKVNRKTRVEVSRDVGREERQTRVVENTNRCHTLQCHYFEVVANYEVTTRLVSVRACVLLENHRPRFTLDWILCHENVLVESLIDRMFLPGFQAAADVKAVEVAKELRTKAELRALEELSQVLAPSVTTVVEAYVRLADAKAAADVVVADCGHGKAFCIWGNLDLQTKARLLAWFALPDVAHAGLQRLRDDMASGVNAAAAFQTFLGSVGTRTFAELRTVAEVQEDVYAFVGSRLWPPLGQDALDRADDAGLSGAVEAAAELARSATEPATDDSGPSVETVAEAQVELERLRCHLEENWLHYSQAVWQRENHGQRLMRLHQEHGPIAATIENELLGFYADRSGYPLRHLDAVTDVDLSEVLGEAEEEIRSAEQPPVLISMPTPGIVLEASLGACNACEDFIRSSRTLDLRTQEAQAQQAEAEADRRAARLAAGDLSAPDHPEAGRLVVEVRSPGDTDTEES